MPKIGPIKEEEVLDTMAQGDGDAATATATATAAPARELTIRTPSKIPEFGAPGSTLTAEAWVDTVSGLAAGGSWSDTATAGHASVCSWAKPRNGEG